MSIKGRLLSLDVGDKRIGVAMCDPMRIVASEKCTIQRNKDSVAIAEIEKICEENQIKKIVVGMPYNMDGTIGEQGNKTVDFVKQLEKNYEILYYDERLSSFEAEQILKKEGKKYTKDKGLVDMKAAALILQDYINETRWWYEWKWIWNN